MMPSRHVLSSLVFVGGIALMVGAPLANPDDDQSDGVRSAVGAAGSSLREQVEFALDGYDNDIDRSSLDDLGSTKHVVDTLRALLVDESARTSLRTRAATALGHYDDVDDLPSFVQHQLEHFTNRAADDSLTRIERHTAEILTRQLISTVAQLSEPQRSAELLASFLKSDALQRRLAAIHALGRHAGEPGRTALRQFAADAELSGDEHRLIRSALSMYIDQ